MNNDVKDDVKTFSYVTLSIAAVFGLTILVSALVWYAVTPTMNDLETRGIEHSYTFVSTEKELLVHLVQDYRKLEVQEQLHNDDPSIVSALEAEKKATVNRIRSEAAKIPNEEIPNEARSFL